MKKLNETKILKNWSKGKSNMEFKRSIFTPEFYDYRKCTVCGYMKYCKKVNKNFICKSCDRIAKEKN